MDVSEAEAGRGPHCFMTRMEPIAGYSKELAWCFNMNLMVVKELM